MWDSSFTLYGAAISQPTNATRALLANKKSIKFEFIPKVLFSTEPGGTKDPEYLKIFPNGTVPGLEVAREGIYVNEGAAIMQYICEEHGMPEWYPPDAENRVLTNEYLHMHHGSARKLTYIFIAPLLPSFGLPMYTKKEMLEQSKPILKLIEQLLEKHQFLGGDKMTIADLQCFMELHQPVTLNIFSYSGFPKIAAWHDKMKKNGGVKEILNLPENVEAYAGWRDAIDDYDVQKRKSGRFARFNCCSG